MVLIEIDDKGKFAEMHWQRCTVDTASASETEDPGSNPAQVIRFLWVKIAMLLCIFDSICMVCVLKK
jgi:hypothetical protein